jgi:hypothetical protein
MVVHNLDITGIALSPHKTNPPLIVNSNAVLPLSISTQGFQAVSWWNAEIIQRFRPMEQQQLSSGDPLKCAKARHLFIGEQRLGRL